MAGFSGRFGKLQIVAVKDQALIADKCHMAECFFDRLIGLIGRRKLEPGSGMFFPRCNSVHMWFMSIPIDIVFLRKLDGQTYEVTSCRSHVRPWKIIPLADRHASETLELPAGTISGHEIAPGDRLCIS